MPRKILRDGRNRPPWWFGPVVMAGLGIAATGLAALMLPLMD